MPRIRPPVPSSRALPATVADLEAQRLTQVKPKLIDEIEKVLFALYEDPDFRALRGVDDPEKFVEDDEVDDDVRSALMIREKGKEMNMPLIRAATTHAIRLKLRGAERRFNVSRKQRATAPRAA